MYLSYFGFAEAPFSIAPDPRYLYMTRSHQEALAHLLYGVNGDGGFVLLTGEVGAGKTTVCRCLLEQVPATCDVAYVFNPKLTVEELLQTVCAELGIACPPGTTSIKVFVDCINAHLLDANSRGRHTVLIIDEAQNLSAEVLEQMRLLTNLETNQRKLLQIILLGQPELLAMLERPSMRQLAQRIVARYHLGPLSRPDVAAYVRHRLQVAGAERQLFPDSVMGRLYRLSKGVPRVINVLCDRALLGAYVQGKERVDRATLDTAASEVFGRKASPTPRMRQALIAVLVLVAGGAMAVAVYQQDLREISKSAPAAGAKSAATSAPSNSSKNLQQDKPVPSLAQAIEWPEREPRARSRALAQAALLKAWGANYEGGDLCRQAETLGLRCRSARGGMDELREMNRPAILALRAADGQEFFATLLQLDARSATLDLGGEARPVALAALAAQWSGHFTALWRAPPEARESIKPGQTGPAVAWLAGQLAVWQGRQAVPATGTGFDDAMEKQVRQFQFSKGLIPDGIVGPQTLMRLSGVNDSSAPRLLRGPGE
ncbi:MAG: hypothetical protein A3I63_06545 [Betaproteobacteria bacterium RIFCSPLOWO2_02_FULL_66_14]|nr:MAG: hypothetical protein A3I63_06545 [Betaproteobacteria bacterium RIFCSPLOWO2_02_FULL_66_14]